MQVLLLRAIETGEYNSLGASKSKELRARIIAATDANLEQLIREKQFRAPLLHRLSACEVHLPPLREHREDIARLLLHFLRIECCEQGCPFPLDREGAETAPWLPLRLLVKLASYDWPGNVRQLRNAVRQLVLASGNQPSLGLPNQLAKQLAAAQDSVARLPLPQAGRRKPADISETELLAALTANRWDLKATAVALGIARPSLYMLLERSPQLRTTRTLSASELEQSYRECSGDLDVMAARLRISRSALRRRLREAGIV